MSTKASTSFKKFTHGIASQAFVIFLVIISICFTLSMKTAGHEADLHTTDYIPQIAMTSAMLIGLLIMIYFIVCPKSVRSSHEHPHHVRHTIHGRLALGSIVLFYILGNFLDFSQFAAELSCWSAWSGCYEDNVRLSHRVVILFHLVRVIFTGCEMLICVVFHHHTMRRRRLLLYGLAVVSAANMALWFDSLVCETFHHVAINETPVCITAQLGGHTSLRGHGGGDGGHEEGYRLYRREAEHGDQGDNEGSVAEELEATSGRTSGEHETTTSTHWNVTSEMLHCWDKTSSEYEWLKDCSTFLYAMLIEWALLVSESMADWLVGSVPDEDEAQQNRNNSLLTEESGIGEKQEQKEEDHFFAEQRDMRNGLSRVILEDSTSEQEIEDKASRWHQSCSKIFVTFAALFNIGFCMVSILLFYSCESTDEAYATYSDMFHIYSIFYFLFLICLTVIGFLCCCGFDRPEVETSYLEYLLLACVVGPLFISTMRLTSHQVLTAHSGGTWGFAYGLEEVCRLFQAVAQSIFYFYAKDVTFVIRHRHPSRITRLPSVSQRITNLPQSFSRKIGLKDTLSVLALSNAILWIVESGILPLAVSPTQSHGHGEWIVLESIMDPIILFYRFNSALLFFSVYLCIRKKYRNLPHV